MIFTLGGYPINWISKLQTIVALLPIDAEYRTLSKGEKEVVWLKRLLLSLKFVMMHRPNYAQTIKVV